MTTHSQDTVDNTFWLVWWFCNLYCCHHYWLRNKLVLSFIKWCQNKSTKASINRHHVLYFIRNPNRNNCEDAPSNFSIMGLDGYMICYILQTEIEMWTGWNIPWLIFCLYTKFILWLYAKQFFVYLCTDLFNASVQCFH